MSEFLQMGGYGGYVWACYAAAVLLKSGILWALLARRHALLAAADADASADATSETAP